MDVFGGALRCHSPEGKGREGPKCETRAACRGRGNGARGSPGGGGRAAELARTNESRKEEAKSFSVKRPKPTERRRRSLAEAKRSELCSPRRSAALRPRPSGRRPGLRCGDGTRCSPVRPSENGRTLMCVMEAAHAACAWRAPASLGAPPPAWPRPGGLPVPAPRFSPGALSAEPGGPARGGFTALTVVVVSEASCGPPGASPGEPSELLGTRSVCRHCGPTSPPICLSGRGSRD